MASFSGLGIDLVEEYDKDKILEKRCLLPANLYLLPVWRILFVTKSRPIIKHFTL